ncbi:MAG: hypothetical protein J0M10_17080 [Chitinophagales bacterium]|nr:hypothetical protein [Chitinophagales bacterium]
MKQTLTTTNVFNAPEEPVYLRISLEEQLRLQEAMQPACRGLVALVRLGYYFRYHTDAFLSLWNEYWGVQAGLELGILKVHLREVSFLKPALEKQQGNIQKYMDQLHLLSQLVQADAAGESRKAWGADTFYQILRNHYPDEWCWLLYSYQHPEAEELEAKLLISRGRG